MPARSKKQQKFFGLVRAIQKGTVSSSSVSPAARKAARSISVKSARDFASTKRSGLPARIGRKRRRSSSDGTAYS